MRYRYFTGNNNTICVSSFAGKSVVGKAKCLPTDSFNEETGKELAKRRCDVKVAEKRLKRAIQKEKEARDAMTLANEEYAKKIDYLHDAILEVDNAKEDLEEFLRDLKDNADK